jgi:O-antigen ligase
MKPIRVGICVLVAFAVLCFGAVEEWSQAVLAVGASVLLVYWAARQYVHKSEQLSIPREIIPLCGFALLGVLQLAFHTASRYATRMELQLLCIYLILLFLMTQSFTRARHWRTYVWFVMALGFAVSIFGILQYLTFNNKLYWARVMHYGGIPFGPYVNRNHFAGFAELVIPVALVPLFMGKVRRERLLVVALFALVPMVALMLSASRGGIVSFAVEMVLLVLLLVVRRIRSRDMILGGLVVVMAVMSVSWIGVQQVLQRFSGMQSLEVSSGKRAAMRHDTWRLFLDHPAMGTGLGTFEMAFPPYDSQYDGKVVNHAHNDYVEALAETGIAGGLLSAWFIGWVLFTSLKGLQEQRTSFGAVLNLSGLIACCGILVHSLADFNLHIPANALLFFLTAHMAVVRIEPANPEVPQPHHQSRHRRIRKQPVGITQ